MIEITSPLAGTVVRVAASGNALGAGAELAVIESMKMQHVVTAPEAGVAARVQVAPGDLVGPGDRLLSLEPSLGQPSEVTPAGAPVRGERADLQAVRARHAVGLDAARPDAVERRRRTGQRTARENVEHLLDEGSLVEYGRSSWPRSVADATSRSSSSARRPTGWSAALAQWPAARWW